MSRDMTDLKALLGVVATGKSLTEAQAEEAFDIMMSGNATPAQMGGFLMALRVRGETVDEIAGAARTMRAKAIRIEAPAGAIDVVGTGGDGAGTFNISTTAALGVAGCGVPVAKHATRAVSSKSGAADVLTALGINIDCDFALVARAIREAGVGFMMAPRHHGAMRHVGGARVELGTRTVFNILGPLTNPAFVKRQLVGAFGRQWIEPMAKTLAKLGSERAWVVHGSDGMDELTLTGPSYVAALDGGKVTTFEVTPEEAGLGRAKADDLKGGDGAANALRIRSMFTGERGPLRDVVLYNAGAALLVAGKAKDLKDGVAMAAQSIDRGKAAAALEKLVAITNSPAPEMAGAAAS
ncbi:MAG: anthranilate phosphoribosyltransferase [Alphaproteobacteria bacterium]|nr:anthranilate phosphoribosyltransferase [Alphaproteobacteria bacterium]